MKKANESLQNARKSGVLMHVSSLPGRFSIGSFGAEARRFVDFLSSAGFRIWQVLPFCSTDECNSPYKSPAAFGGNPYFIDLPTLYEKGLLTDSELRDAEQRSPWRCEYERLGRERMTLLRRAASRVGDRSKVMALMEEIPELARTARFNALREANGGKPHYEWTVFECDPEDLFFFSFIEYEFYTEWQALRAYANERDLLVIGDMPIYVDHNSCEVWSSPESFLLDPDGMPSSVAGVPPDYFSEDGQFWGNPLYNWKRMAEDGYAWWRERLAYALRLFDGVRIDHFRAFDTYWAIPRGSETAKSGKWKKGPGRPLIRALKEVAGDRLIIAEDLGDITEGVVRLLEYSGFPGMRIFNFGFLGDEDSPNMPHNYSKNCVAYTGTHDNDTLLGFVWGMDGRNRERFFEYCGYEGKDWHEGLHSVRRALFASPADTVILPMQDLLLFGSDTRMNTPGTAEGNWEFRITMDQLESLSPEYFLRMNILYARATVPPIQCDSCDME